MKTSDIEVKYIQHCGSDLSVVNAARVSFDKESFEFKDQDEKLIKYLASHGHISPFHHTFITLRVKAPIFVARQLVKHKFMPWNEVSRRYVDIEPEFYVPNHQWRLVAKNKKQGSLEEYIDEDTSVYVQNDVETLVETALETYNFLLKVQVAPEQARMVLPQNTITEWYWSGTLSAWASMLNLRLKPDAQKESRDVALLCYDIIKPLFPVSLENLIEV